MTIEIGLEKINANMFKDAKLLSTRHGAQVAVRVPRLSPCQYQRTST